VNNHRRPGQRREHPEPPAPPPFLRKVSRLRRANLYVRPKELVGDRDPREHEFSVQLRAFDSARSGFCRRASAFFSLSAHRCSQKSIKGGLRCHRSLNLGVTSRRSSPVAVVEIAIERVAPAS